MNRVNQKSALPTNKFLTIFGVFGGGKALQWVLQFLGVELPKDVLDEVLLALAGVLAYYVKDEG